MPKTLSNILIPIYKQRKLCSNFTNHVKRLNTSSLRYDDEKPTDKQPKNPLSRTFRVLQDSIKSPITNPEDKIKVPKHTDVLIVGGGIIGSSIAYWLKQRAPESFSCTIVERDPTYTRSTTALSVGGIRQQFSLQENIELSLFSAKFLRNYKQHLSCLGTDLPDIKFQPHGYLFLASEGGVDQLKENHRLQLELGSKVELLSAKGLKGVFPWLNTDNIALGSYGRENEGWFDPWALLSAFKLKSMSLGCKHVNANVTGFKLKDQQGSFSEEFNESFKNVNHAKVKTPDGNEHEIEFCILIVAAGSESGNVGRMLRMGTGPGILQYAIPVEPRKRFVYVFHCPNGPGIECPLMIDPTGTYFRREGLGGNYVGGKSPCESEEPDCANLEVDYTFFDREVWPKLAERVPCFEAIKVRSAWAGYYDYNTLDQNALIGSHPYYNNVIFATGLSGHGIQMAPAIGRAVMELVFDGEFKSINLDRFGLNRIIMNEPLCECNIV